MKKILILEASSNQAHSIAKFLQRYSDLYIVGHLYTSTLFSPKYYDEITIGTLQDIDLSLFDYLLPTGARSTHDILSNQHQLTYENDVRMEEATLVCFDKTFMLQVCRTLQVPIPLTYTLSTIPYFPIFYKEAFESGGGDRGIAFQRNELPVSEKLIYQEYIDTPSTYGIGFICQNGEILTYTMHKEVISYPIQGGSAVVIEQFSDKRLLEYTQKILRTLNYSGWGLAEYKFCSKRSDFVFMEINAKMWASIEFMLLTNPEFMKRLFNINYHAITVNRMLFVNRLLAYPFKSLKQNFKYIFTSDYRLIESNPIHQLLIPLIPKKLKSFAKRLLLK